MGMAGGALSTDDAEASPTPLPEEISGDVLGIWMIDVLAGVISL